MRTEIDNLNAKLDNIDAKIGKLNFKDNAPYQILIEEANEIKSQILDIQLNLNDKL